MTPICAQQPKLSESDLRSLSQQALTRLASVEAQLKAADDLISSQDAELKASAKEREVAKQERETLQRIVAVTQQEVDSYKSALESERVAAQAMKDNLVVQQKEVERQKRKVSSANKRTILAGIAAAAATLFLMRH